MPPDLGSGRLPRWSDSGSRSESDADVPRGTVSSVFAFVDTGPLERGALGGGSVAFICQACAIGFVCMGSRPPTRMLWALRSPRFAPVARGPRHAMSEPSTRTGTLKIHLYRSEDEGPLPGSLLLDGSCLDGLQVSDVLGAYLYDKWKRRQESRYEDY